MTIFGIFLIYIGRFRTTFVQTNHNYGLFQDSDEESYRRGAESPPTLDRVVQFFSWQEKIKGNPLEFDFKKVVNFMSDLMMTRHDTPSGNRFPPGARQLTTALWSGQLKVQNLRN